MKSAFIIHDSFSDPSQHWYPWLEQQLTALGYTVFVPRFPTPDHQSLAEWVAVFDAYRSNVSNTSIFIGHGTGCAFILRLLEKEFPRIRASFFIAPFISEVPHQALQLASATFTSTPFAWKIIHEHAPSLISFASDDDPFIPLDFSTQASELFGTPLITLSALGHFSDPTGTMTLPPLLEKITELDAVKKSEAETAKLLLRDELAQAGVHVPDEKVVETDDDLFLHKQTLDPVHTYYKDITHMLHTANTKDMAAILRKEREEEAVVERTKKQLVASVIYALLTCLLIISSILVLQRLRSSAPTANPLVTTTAIDVPSLILADSSSSLSLQTNSLFTLRTTIREHIRSTPVPVGTIHHIYPTFPTSVGNRPVLLPFLFTALELQLPDKLLTTLARDYMYGIYGDSTYEPFLLITLSSFDRAFLGMRAWERSLAQDLQDIFALDTELVRPSLYTRAFTDEVINNYPVRILRAPRYTREIRSTRIEELVPAPPTRHILSAEVLSSIDNMTDTHITFKDPSDFLKNLSVGDIIIGATTDSGHPAFLRKILGFQLEGDQLLVLTRPANAHEAVVGTDPTAPVSVRILDDGSLEYYREREETTPIDIEGPAETILLYTFINDKYLLITTDEDVIGAVVARLGSKERDIASGLSSSSQ